MWSLVENLMKLSSKLFVNRREVKGNLENQKKRGKENSKGGFATGGKQKETGRKTKM